MRPSDVLRVWAIVPLLLTEHRMCTRNFVCMQCLMYAGPYHDRLHDHPAAIRDGNGVHGARKRHGVTVHLAINHAGSRRQLEQTKNHCGWVPHGG